MKKILASLVPALLLLAASCARDETISEGGGLAFGASMAATVRSAPDTLLHQLREEYSLIAVGQQEDVPSKAAPVDEVYERLGVFGYRYAQWSDSCPASLLYNAEIVRSGSLWKSSRKMLSGACGADLKMRFYAYGPYGAEGLEPSCTTGAPLLRYKVPEAVDSQRDIIVGESGEMPADASSISLSFRHVLSSLDFAVDADCSDALVKSISLKGVYGQGDYVPSEGWSALCSPSDYTLDTDAQVLAGSASVLASGSNTMMLLPQTFPEGSSLELGLELEGEAVNIEVPIAGLSILPGHNYRLRMNFHVTLFDSQFTYHINLADHRALSFTTAGNIALPQMRFASGTEAISVEWGDGSCQSFTSGYVTPAHSFPSGYEGDIVVKIKGESPQFVCPDSYVQFIKTISIEGNERYDTGGDRNCIFEPSTGTLVYAASLYSFPPDTKILAEYSMVGIENTTLAVPEGVTTIRSNAFGGPNAYLQRVQLPASLTLLEDGAFCGNGLDYCTVDESNSVYCNSDGCIVERSSRYVKLCPKYASIPSDAKGLRPYSCDHTSSAVILPDSCTDLMERAFYNASGLKSVSLPDGCTIGLECFSLCASAEFTFRGSVTSAGRYAFYWCKCLTSIDLGMFGSIGAHCFDNATSITSVTVPPGYALPASAFYSCTSLTSVSIPQGCSLGGYTFYSCTALKTVSLASTLKSSADFASCSSLASLELLDGCTAVISNSFSLSPLTRIDIRAASAPTTVSWQLYKSSGEVHVNSGQDYTSWMSACGFTAKGWTWVDDL